MVRLRRNYAAAAQNLSVHYTRLTLRNLATAARLGPVGTARWIADVAFPRRAPPPRQQARRVQLAIRRLIEAGADMDAIATTSSGAAAEAGAVGSAKPRLAMVTPYPPDRTGIAGYAADLAEALCADYDITVITERAAGAQRSGPPIRSHAWFLNNAGSFDRVLYHLGNAPYHAATPELLARRPGVVVLHDLGLGDLGHWLEGRGDTKGQWPRWLYDSHGYAAVAKLAAGPAEALADEPSSGWVFEQSQGVLVHSRFARDRAEALYGPEAAARTQVIPFLQRSRSGERLASRQALGLAEGELLVCTFGFAGRTKLSLELIEAWQGSALAQMGRLVLVGQAPDDDYGRALCAAIAARPDLRVSITGYASAETFEAYLAAADVAVQLRSATRGESSGALFDCLAAGATTLVNAHGALAEAPADAVLIIPDQFTTAELRDGLERLAQDPELRRRLGERGREIVRADHAPEVVARRYHELIEAFAQSAPPLNDPQAIARAAGDAAGASDLERARISAAERLAAMSGDRPGLACLYVDVTAIAAQDLGSGVQRVVRAQLQGLLKAPPACFRVEPVRIVMEDAAPRLFLARSYTSKLIGLPPQWLWDEPVELRSGDIYYAPDLAQDMVVRAAQGGLFASLRAAGVSVHVLVHDLLPMELPQCFPPGAAQVHERWLRTVAREADQLICISEAVLDGVRRWMAGASPGQDRPPPRLSRLHHGADLDGTAVATRAAPSAIMAAVHARPTFVMVGTVEPRKGYDQVLAAFEQLWAGGFEVNLVVVGAEGWRELAQDRRSSIPQVVRRLQTSPAAGRQLFWLQDASDSVLLELFRDCACLIAASWGEGFGLPLIEAARAGLPILARDIPVFREVAGAHAAYFDAKTPEGLARAIGDWLGKFERGQHPRSADMPFQTWAENVEALKAALVAGPSPNRSPRAAAEPGR